MKMYGQFSQQQIKIQNVFQNKNEIKKKRKGYYQWIYLLKELQWEPTNFQDVQLCFHIWCGLIYKLQLVHTHCRLLNCHLQSRMKELEKKMCIVHIFILTLI